MPQRAITHEEQVWITKAMLAGCWFRPVSVGVTSCWACCHAQYSEHDGMYTMARAAVWTLEKIGVIESPAERDAILQTLSRDAHEEMELPA